MNKKKNKRKHAPTERSGRGKNTLVCNMYNNQRKGRSCGGRRISYVSFNYYAERVVAVAVTDNFRVRIHAEKEL